MKATMRLWSRAAFVIALGAAQLVACSSDSARPTYGDEKRSGTLSMALEATAPSGITYRLRDAEFEIVDMRTGNTVDILFSEENPPTVQELTTLLLTGNYTVTLNPGWFLERIGGVSPGTGGSAGATGGTGGGPIGGMGSTGGTGSTGSTGSTGGTGGIAGSSGGKGGGVGGTSGKGGGGGKAGGGAQPDPGMGGTIGVAGAPNATGGTGFGGAEGEGEGGESQGGTGGSVGVRVEAQLLSDAVQFFSIFGGDEQFVSYQFRVGEEIIDFNRGRVRIGIGVIDDVQCQPPPEVIDPKRVLMETNVDALSNISLFQVLQALATNDGQNADPNLLFQQVYDSYATADQAILPDAVHCGDETTDGVPTLNGYPIECNRVERIHVDDLGGFFPTAFVNRLDLAPQNGAHCGQQRTIFASSSFNRAFIILEAQIPNPEPDLGIQGCAPLAQFWLDQDAIDDPFLRGERLAEAFLNGSPKLLEAGFGPFYTATNLTIGSGQIRTNQFDQDPWTLREFKLALDGETLTVIPFPVAEAPNGALWNENVPLPQGPACRENFLVALDGLLTDDPNEMSFIVDNACKDAESRNDFSQAYANQLSEGFREQLLERLQGTGLSPENLAQRAHFAGSCIGCHEEANGSFLGNDVFAPFSGGFTHVSEFPTSCDNEVGTCFSVSSAVNNTFLPSRLQTMGQLLEIPIPPNPCQGTGGAGGGSSVGGAPGVGGAFPGTGGAFGSGGIAGAFGTAGSFGTGGSGTAGGFPDGGPIDPGMGVGGSGPVEVVEIQLPSADTPVDELQQEEKEIREAYGDKTLGGKSAQSTH
jgi:hypothetical protein